MKKVKPAKSLTYILFTPSSYLTKMEILLIFMLSITAYFAIKMDKPVADNKPINSSLTLVETVDQNDIKIARINRGHIFNVISADAEGEIIEQANHQQLLAL